MSEKKTVRVTLKKDVFDQFTSTRYLKGSTINTSPAIAKYFVEQGIWSPTSLDHLWEYFAPGSARI